MILLQNSGVPIYQQIANDFRTRILNGEIKADEYLPSIRSLAKELKISVITTMKAYEVLEQEGIVRAIQGKGFCVNPQDTDMMKEQHLRLVENSLNEAIKAAKVAKISNEELIQTLKSLLDMENY